MGIVPCNSTFYSSSKQPQALVVSNEPRFGVCNIGYKSWAWPKNTAVEYLEVLAVHLAPGVEVRPLEPAAGIPEEEGKRIG